MGTLLKQRHLDARDSRPRTRLNKAGSRSRYRWRVWMKRLSPAVMAAILAALASTAAAAAQPRGIMPRLESHVINPSQSLSAPTSNPLQSQMQNDYATGLRAAQR